MGKKRIFKKCCATCERWGYETDGGYVIAKCSSRLEKTEGIDACDRYIKDAAATTMMLSALKDERYADIVERYLEE